jgi:hypothetical protein
MVLARRADMGDVLFKPYLERHARELRRQAAHNLLLQQGKARQGLENQQGWQALCRALPDAGRGQAEEQLQGQLQGQNQPAATPGAVLASDEGAIRQLVLPSGPRIQAKLSRRRRKRYRERLQATIAKALLPPVESEETTPQALAGPPEPLPAPDSALPDRLCACCGGGCCTLGGDHAYLTVPTLRRFMAQHPELNPEQVLAAYLARLPRYGQFGSCIHHTARGCSLSRDMRSDICNQYVCEERGQIEQALQQQQNIKTILVVRRKLDNWTRAAPGLDNRIVALATITEAGVEEQVALASTSCQR